MALLRLIPALSSAPVAALKAQEETREIIKSIARDIMKEARDNFEEDGDWSDKVKGATDIISLLRTSFTRLDSLLTLKLTSYRNYS